MKELASANGLKPTSKLKAGARLSLPEPGGVPEPRTAQTAAAKATGEKKASPSAGAARDGRKGTTHYKVHKGDTLDQIARVYGVTVDRIADRNRLKKDQPIRPGLVLVIPLES
jgi:LysM repeat protein